MAQRLAALKKDQEIDGLRVYLIKYNLFPRNRDPHTSPIRVEELKELVKHWKLHRKRGFWRDHPEKDDLVRALLQYILQESDSKHRKQVAQEKYRMKAEEGIKSNNEAQSAAIVAGEAQRDANAKSKELVFKNKDTAGDMFYQRGAYDEVCSF